MNTLADYVKGFIANINTPTKRQRGAAFCNHYVCNETNETVTVASMSSKLNIPMSTARHKLELGKLDGLTYQKVKK